MPAEEIRSRTTATLTELGTDPPAETATRPDAATSGVPADDASGSKPPTHEKILILDDEFTIVAILKKYLKDAGYKDLVTLTDASKGLDVAMAEQPSVILTDYMMPELNGLELLERLRAEKAFEYTPVLMLTACSDAEVKVKALELGATDFLSKPVDPNELLPRIRNLLVVKAYQDKLQNYSEQLEDEVRARTAELAASRKEIIHTLARAAEYRDNDTGQHVARVGLYAGLVAKKLGFDRDAAETIEQAAQLHDVGKIGISDLILMKPGGLDPDEYKLMQRHCDFGARIIQPVPGPEYAVARKHTTLGGEIMDVSSSSVLTVGATIARTHHEKWDGTGYPLGLAGEAIPIEGRITAVADVFDGLSSKRVYKPAFPREKCLAIMQEMRGTHFDPKVLDAFLAVLPEITRIQIAYASPE